MTPVKLQPAALRSQVKHSTTEPLCSLCQDSVKKTKSDNTDQTFLQEQSDLVELFAQAC